jgi:GPH family glycoside/pentoside/hexuronide:cation symporter
MNKNKVPLKTKIAWGLGGWADNFIFQALMILAFPIYNIELGIDPMWIGGVLLFPRIIDAIMDPIVGNWSDNTRSRWGRRRPFVFAGAALCAVLLPCLWIPLFEGKLATIILFGVLSTIYSVSYSVFAIPYTALGFELTNDYDERTRVLSWRMYFGLIAGLCIPNLYMWCQHDVFGGDIIQGALWVSVGVGFSIFVTGCAPAFFCREKEGNQQQNPIHLKEAIIETIRDKAFRILISGYVIIIAGLLTSASVSLYVNIYHVFEGDKKLAAEVSALSGMVGVLAAYIGVKLANIVAEKTGKRETMIGGMTIAILAVFSMIYTMQPGFEVISLLGFKFHPQIISFLFYGMGQQACWLMVDSMTADVCDEDELRTGLRREGMFGAVKSFALQCGVAITSVTGALALKFAGVGEDSEMVTPEVASILKVVFISIQSVGLVAGIAIFFFYPISRKCAEETQRQLAIKKMNT